MNSNLAKLLVREALVNVDQIRNALNFQRDSGYELGESLVNLGYITESQLVELLGKEYGVPVLSIDDCDIEENILNLIPKDTALEKFLVPIRLEGADLTVAMSDPSNILLLDDLGFITGKIIRPVISSDRAIKDKLSKYYGLREAVDTLPDDESIGEPGNSDRHDRGYLSTDRNNIQIDEIISELEQYEKDQASENRITETEDKLSDAWVDSGLQEINHEHWKAGNLKNRDEVVDKPEDEFVPDFTASSSGDSGSSVPDSDAGLPKSAEPFEADPPSCESGFFHITNELEPASPEFPEDTDGNRDGGKSVCFTSPFDSQIIGPGELTPKIDTTQVNFNAASEVWLPGSDRDGTEKKSDGSHTFESHAAGSASAEEFLNEEVIDYTKENHTADYSPSHELNADSSSMHEAGADSGSSDADPVEESSEIAQAMNPPRPVKSVKKGDRSRGSILIVDVSPTVQKIMRITLERAGYRVYAAGDGMQALARINEQIPDMVFMDIKLPHMDGYQLCKVIKSHGLTRGVPVVMLSGKAGVLDKMKVKMAGASDFITKPFGSDAIVEAAEKYAR
ncbi:MAG: response regulator [Thermodesulfobacteriota bacterium]